MQNKRRQYITHKSYQRGVVLRIILVCAIGLLINLGIFNYFSYEKIESLRWRMHIPVNTVGDIIGQYLIYSTIPSVTLAVIIFLIFLIYIIKKTDRLLYELKNDIEKVAGGDLSFNVLLRGRDDFKDVEDDCNMMISSFRSKFSLIKEKMHGINKTLESLEHVKDKPEIFSQKSQLLIETLEHLEKEV